MQRPTVAIFSEPNLLAVCLLEDLLARFCSVEIFARNINLWRAKTQDLNSQEFFNFFPAKDFAQKDFNYAIFLGLGVKEKNIFLKKAIDYSLKTGCKILVIFSHRGIEEIDRKIKLPETIGVVYIGDLFGPRMEMEKNEPMSQIILSEISGTEVKLAAGKELLPVFAGEAARQIFRWLFSFGPYGKKTKLILQTGSAQYLKETIAWFKKNPPRTSAKVTPSQIKTKLWLLILIALTLLTPYFFLATSIGLLGFTRKGFLQRDLGISGKLVALADFTSSFAAAGIGFLHLPGFSSAKIVKETAGISLRLVKLAEEGRDLTAKIIGNSPYDLATTAQRLEMETDFVYQDVLFLEGELRGKKMPFNFDLPAFKKYLLGAKTLFGQLPEILGNKKKSVYLILLQNNMELRPTGGFLGSFALVTFDGGRVSEIAVQDVYSADGQLKGHIEPPLPIKTYLKEANWYLRDSNWDPDFPASAQRAEWFLDKEVGLEVDGTIAVDLGLVRDLLKVIGPLDLKDYSVALTADNFYEKTQAEVEEDFFPGSQKKSSFLTAVAKALSERLTASLGDKSLGLWQVFFAGLEQKHVQIFFHLQPVQETVNSLGWDGAVEIPSCPGNCFFDWLGLVEANIGVNKANYYLSRNFSLDVRFSEKGEMEKSLAVTYQNSANQALGPKAIYKSFTRLLLAPTASLGKALISTGTQLEDLATEAELVSGRQEVGFYFEVAPGQSRTIILLWQDKNNLDLTRAGEYKLFIRKQPGTDADSLLVNYNFPSFLTPTGSDGYNGKVSQDTVLRVSWLVPKE